MLEALRRFATFVACLVLVAAGAARAQPSAYDTYLNAAVRLYESLDYEAALEQLDKAKKLSHGPDDDALLFMYEGVFRMDLGQAEQARQAFKTGLLLKPDVALQMKISPKVKAEIEKLREQVKKELAPMLAKQEAERMKKAEDERKAEEKRKLDAARVSADAAAKKPPPPAATVVTDAKQVDLVPRDKPVEVVEPVAVKKSRVPVVPIVFLGVGAVAGGVGTYFGLQSRQQVTDANKPGGFQDETVRKLNDAQTNGTIANVMFGVAAAAGIGALIGFLVGSIGDHEAVQ